MRVERGGVIVRPGLVRMGRAGAEGQRERGLEREEIA